MKYFSQFLSKAIDRSKFFRPKLLAGYSLYDMLLEYIQGVFKGGVTSRASAISFSFFLALFPATIFVFSVIPYIPIEDFQYNLMEYIAEITPPKTYEVIEVTLNDIIHIKHGGVLSIGFLTAYIFATNGVNSVISGISYTYHNLETRGILGQYTVSLGVSFILLILLILVLSANIFTEYVLFHFQEEFRRLAAYIPLLLTGIRYLLSILLIYISIALLFYVSVKRVDRFKFWSLGALFSTFLILITSVLFGFYVVHFAQYNKLYGSIGTLLLILFWIYLNSLAILLGFELNATISKLRIWSRREKEEHSNQ